MTFDNVSNNLARGHHVIDLVASRHFCDFERGRVGDIEQGRCVGDLEASRPMEKPCDKPSLLCCSSK